MDKKYNTELQISRPDPVSLAQQAKYKQQGLTVTSNNTSIIPRDTAGNIILQENSETNPILIIEPVTTKITTNSILRVIETRFQYYSFPASIIAVATAADLNVDFTLDSDTDLIFARYKPSENSTVAAPSLTPSGILMDEIESGGAQKNTNVYYINKEIKNSGKDLRFRVKINHRYDGINDGYALFTITKQGPNFDLERNYKPGYIDNGGPLPGDTWHTKPLFYTHGNFQSDTVIQWQGEDDIESANAEMKRLNVRSTIFDVVIQNSEFAIGDNFGIAIATVGTGHTINSEQSYWVITDASKNVDEWNQEI